MRAILQVLAAGAMMAMGAGCASGGTTPAAPIPKLAMAVTDGVTACGEGGCLEVGQGESTFWLRNGKLAIAQHIDLCVDNDGTLGGGVVLRDCAESRARWLSSYYDHHAVLIDRTTDLCLAITEPGRAAEMVRCEAEASGMVLAPLSTQ